MSNNRYTCTYTDIFSASIRFKNHSISTPMSFIANLPTCSTFFHRIIFTNSNGLVICQMHIRHFVHCFTTNNHWGKLSTSIPKAIAYYICRISYRKIHIFNNTITRVADSKSFSMCTKGIIMSSFRQLHRKCRSFQIVRRIIKNRIRSYSSYCQYSCIFQIV